MVPEIKPGGRSIISPFPPRPVEGLFHLETRDLAPQTVQDVFSV